MILKGEIFPENPGATLDDLFRRAGVRTPQAAALVDPPNRAAFTDGAPRILSYAQADRAISAFAIRLRGLGLATDAVVAIQLANTVEAVIAFLGVLRAGMIAAPIPLLWRQQDMVTGLRAIDAKAIVTCARIGSYAPIETAILAAAELFSIRHICAFGEDVPDGVVPLDGDRAPAVPAAVAASARRQHAPAHVAVITFDTTAQGMLPVARNHLQLVSGGLAAFLESGLAQHATLLSAIPPTSFAGIALGIVPWLLAGGTLALHHGCDLAALSEQCADFAGATAILPGPALNALDAAGRLGNSLRTVLALWRAPERLEAASAWSGSAPLVDVASFGEVGLLAARRPQNDRPAPIPCGLVGAPRGAADPVNVAETRQSRSGTLLLRGPMVPALVYASDTEQTVTTEAELAGFVDTGFACRRDGACFVLTGSPAGLAFVGGYRFRRQALDEALRHDMDAALVTVPEASLGERLAGSASDPLALRAALQARGVNALLTAAFRRRGAADAA